MYFNRVEAGLGCEVMYFGAKNAGGDKVVFQFFWASRSNFFASLNKTSCNSMESGY